MKTIIVLHAEATYFRMQGLVGIIESKPLEIMFNWMLSIVEIIGWNSLELLKWLLNYWNVSINLYDNQIYIQ